jgi:ATP-dependent Clp protease adaptor protein ClpS
VPGSVLKWRPLAIRTRSPKFRIVFLEEAASMTDGNPTATTRVLLLNDDETTMEFVVEVLEDIFGKTRDEAIKLMLQIHNDGRGACGVYSLEEAAQLVEDVTEMARQNGFPLRCIVESD